MSQPDDFTFRPRQHQDIPFIQSSWAQSYFGGRAFHKGMSAKVFHEHHRPIRDRILYERGNATVIVCCSKEDPWLIIAWIAVEQLDDSLTIHYVYVKEAFKGLGIARRLVNMVSKGDVIYFTHLTDKMSKIAKARRDHRYKYVPHLV